MSTHVTSRDLRTRVFPTITMLRYWYILSRPVRRGSSLGSYEPPPPSGTCGKQKSEPNHFVAVQELIEGSELEVSLKRLKFPSVYALYHRTVLHLVMTSLGDCDSSHRFRGQWELFRNVTPLFKTLRTGLLSLQYISFAKGFCESE